MSDNLLPPLNDWEPTRQTLQLYCRGMAAIPRVHAVFHPKWWHISFKVQPDGLVTEKMTLPDGGRFWLKMNLRQHKVQLFTNLGKKNGTEQRTAAEFSMTDGLSATKFGDLILGAVAELGLTAEYDRQRFENDSPNRVYKPAVAERFLTALVEVNRIFKEHQATLDGDVSPVQLWPHNFDLAFEWFGTRVEKKEENGEAPSSSPQNPSDLLDQPQLNLGFYPGDPDSKPYFYSNPWPFEADLLLHQSLPEGAAWHTEGWQGTILPYSQLVNDPKAEQRLRSYARRVFEISKPTLLA